MYLVVERHKYSHMEDSFYVKKATNDFQEATKIKKLYQELNNSKTVEYQISTFVEKIEREVA